MSAGTTTEESIAGSHRDGGLDLKSAVAILNQFNVVSGLVKPPPANRPLALVRIGDVVLKKPVRDVCIADGRQRRVGIEDTEVFTIWIQVLLKIPELIANLGNGEHREVVGRAAAGLEEDGTSQRGAMVFCRNAGIPDIIFV